MIFGHRGGIWPQKRKNRTARKPLAELDVMPEELVFYLDGSTEAPAKAVVRLHQKVREEELIAEAQGEGVPIYASLAGRVTAIEERRDGQGKVRPAIVLGVEPEGGVMPSVEIDWTEATPPELIQRVGDFGLVEQVGDPVPLYGKILQGRGRVDTLIVNGTECQPYLTATYRLGMERGRDLIAGGQILARLLGVNQTVFAITGDALNSVERLERDLRRSIVQAEAGKSLKVRALPAKYPLYHDKQIVREVLGVEIPPDCSAVDVGCQVFSLAAVCALGRAFVKGRPVTRTAVTVAGYGVVRPRNLWVPLGTSLHTLLQNCEGVSQEPAMTLLGGLFTGNKVNSLQGSVEQNAQGILCLIKEELPPLRRQQSCLQCGRCVGVCPMGLCPVFVARAMLKGNLEKLEGLHPQDCINCGACASVCPSHIPLVRMMKSATDYVLREETE